ncbi:MAG: DUF427 domain-containing protein [Caulobacteraceae bacterium]|nr:DUF427 domain-containing protein [Caulobacteraceae bacterium]
MTDPNHPITIEPARQRWRVRYAGHVIADSADALVLREASYPPVVYFPRQDVSMEYMARTEHRTHCPYKGDASYYSLVMDGDLAENAIWTYETPIDDMALIRGRLAFYPNLVEIYEVDDAEVNPHASRSRIDEVILHTDSGSGASQREHYKPNVSLPGGPLEGA